MTGAPPGAGAIAALRGAVTGRWHGDPRVVDLVLTAALAGGHVLLEDVPGVGKTTLASALAGAIGGRFRRIQCTSDLLPGDLTGVTVLGRDGEGRFREGPIFAHVVLADEINRTTPRTQSALLEAMGEGRVTVDGTTHVLPDPFLVIATQNPFDLHGTFPLPDSQLDRFLLRLSLGYPSREDERRILQQPVQGLAPVGAAVTPEALVAVRAQVDAVRVAREAEDYLLDLVWHTRSDSRLLRGVSPRGALALHRAVRAHAMVQGRTFVVPEDVVVLAGPVLGHRVVPRGAAGTGEEVVRAVLDDLTPPR